MSDLRRIGASYSSQTSGGPRSIEDIRWSDAAAYVSPEIKEQTDLAIEGDINNQPSASTHICPYHQHTLSPTKSSDSGDDKIERISESDTATAAECNCEESQTNNIIVNAPCPVLLSDECPEKQNKYASSPEPAIIWVEWEENDPENPLNWSRKRKWTSTILSITLTLLVSSAAAIYAEGIPSMQKELKNSDFLSNLGTAMYPLGFGIPPMILAPFSEVYGRNAVYIPTFFLYIIFFIPLGLGKNIETIIIARFLSGCWGSAGSTMVGGTLADIWESHERGIPMGLFTVTAFSGMGIGPVYAGWIEQALGWRWIEWIFMMFSGVIFVIFVFTMKETRASVLLSRRAEKLRKETGDQRYQCRADSERGSFSVMMKTSLTRPIIYLATEPVIFCFSLWIAFAWGMMWALLPAMTLVFQNIYHFNSGELGTTYLALECGALIGMALIPLQERIYKKRFPKDGPEARLYLSCFGGLAVPIGTFIFGWTQGRGPWIAPLIGVGYMMFGNFTLYQAIFAYLADAYTLYASSAIAGQSLCRNVFGFAFPLFTTAMYNKLGYSWAASLVGFISLALACIPFILIKYGVKLRARSKALQELSMDIERRRQLRLQQEQQAVSGPA